MSLACQVAHGVRSPWRTRVPSSSRRKMARSSRELMSSRPSGSHPRPAGSPSKGTSTRRSPSGEAEKTAWSKKSEYQSRPSCQRGHSPKNRPDRNGSAVSVSLTVLLPPAPGSLGRSGPQFSTDRAPVRRRPPRATFLDCDVLGAQGGVDPDLLRALPREGGGEGEHPPTRRGGAGRQPPVVLRLLLHPPRGPAQGHLPRQGGVLRLVEDGLVLPGRRPDPDPAGRGGRLGAGPRHRPQRR